MAVARSPPERCAPWRTQPARPPTRLGSRSRVREDPVAASRKRTAFSDRFDARVLHDMIASTRETGAPTRQKRLAILVRNRDKHAASERAAELVRRNRRREPTSISFALSASRALGLMRSCRLGSKNSVKGQERNVQYRANVLDRRRYSGSSSRWSAATWCRGSRVPTAASAALVIGTRARTRVRTKVVRQSPLTAPRTNPCHRLEGQLLDLFTAAHARAGAGPCCHNHAASFALRASSPAAIRSTRPSAR